MTVYVAVDTMDRHNASMAENVRILGIFSTEEAAVAALQNQSVRGVTGDVYSATLDEVPTNNWGNVLHHTNKVYGYRRDWRGNWTVGYVDNRDAPDDPEVQEFMRLREKFEGAL